MNVVVSRATSNVQGVRVLGTVAKITRNKTGHRIRNCARNWQFVLSELIRFKLFNVLLHWLRILFHCIINYLRMTTPANGLVTLHVTDRACVVLHCHETV